ncbi:hypothetical protein HRR78_002090 [Exophiala dermatitidis]|nr:hypothetical protein HRR78_002090 [Exophiala dermatitidis]
MTKLRTPREWIYATYCKWPLAVANLSSDFAKEGPVSNGASDFFEDTFLGAPAGIRTPYVGAAAIGAMKLYIPTMTPPQPIEAVPLATRHWSPPTMSDSHSHSHDHSSHTHDHDHDHGHSHSHDVPPHLFQATSSDDHPPDNWRESGVRVIPANSLDTNTAQTPGMNRAAAITTARVGAQKLWAGTVKIHPNAKTGAHHHGHLESVIYVVKGKARMRWGERLEFTAEAGPGDFIYVPPYVPHQEINAKEDEELECVLMRSDGEAIAVNLPDVEPVETPEGVKWIDPTHPTGGV